MITYEYECRHCNFTKEECHSIKDDPIFNCPNCDSKEPMSRNIGLAGGFILKESSIANLLNGTPEWSSKAFREESHKERVNKKMERRQLENNRQHELIPNVGGEVCPTWSDAAKLAKDKGLNSDSHIKMHEKQKEQKNKPKGWERKSF